MEPAPEKLRNTTRLRQMLRQWRKRAKTTHASTPPLDHLAVVCVASRNADEAKSGSKLRTVGQIVQLYQMLKRWRARAHSHSSWSSSSSSPPSDVPPGHLAVCVGSNCTRFVVRTSYLNHPMFLKLLTRREEYCGFSSMPGPLEIPCDESFFEEIIRYIDSKKQPSPSSSMMISIL